LTHLLLCTIGCWVHAFMLPAMWLAAVEVLVLLTDVTLRLPLRSLAPR
jgi:hypothetical protein